MWKVRMVSWVPGSPMDCPAEMMPTASPRSTMRPEARLRPKQSWQTPRLDSQVSTERILTRSIPAAWIAPARSSVISLIDRDDAVALIGRADLRAPRGPRCGRAEAPMDFTRFNDGLDVDPVARAAIGFGDDDVLGHVAETARQIAGIRGLQLAVSARPLRAPCVEMKYSRTFSPSRKLAVMGVSRISPDGLAHQAAHSGKAGGSAAWNRARRNRQ